jgi:hypothetical protein
MKAKHKVSKKEIRDVPEEKRENARDKTSTYLSYVDFPGEEESPYSSTSLSEIFEMDNLLKVISKKISTEDLELFGSYVKDPFPMEEELRAAAKIFENLCKKLDDEQKSIFFDVVYELADGRWTTLNGLLKSLPRDERIAFSEHIFKTIPLLSRYTSL